MKSAPKLLALIAFIILVSGGLFWWLIGPDWRTLLLDPPANTNVLFWSQGQRDVGFKILDTSSLLVKTHSIAASKTPKTLEMGQPLELSTDIDAFMNEQRLSGALVLHKGQIRLEQYRLGHSPEGRWTSFSVAKSFTSTLVGAALKDGDIKSLDDKVSTYLTELKGSVYADVSIAQLLTMTSGVAWNESYTDPESDVAKFNFHKAEEGVPNIVSYMKNLSRAHPPGERWLYSTGETNLIGILVARATGKNLSDYLSEKIWQPFGMANRASWILGPDGNEISGCCMQASLRDFARYGLFVLADGKINGESIVPVGWFVSATRKQADIGQDGRGYGYQWWTFDDGSFTARGIFGQTLYIDPQRELVVAFNGNWPNANAPELDRKRFEFIDEIRAFIDGERVNASFME